MPARYVVIANDLKDRIERGEITYLFPTYAELVNHYDSSFRTVVKVMDKLRAEGVVETTTRRSYVIKRG